MTYRQGSIYGKLDISPYNRVHIEIGNRLVVYVQAAGVVCNEALRPTGMKRIINDM
jgi:hypothetical protein